MGEILRRIARWTIPPGFYTLFAAKSRQSPGILRRSTEISSVLSQNRELKDSRRGDRCFILATGPSIKQQDLTLLEGEVCISVSNFFVHPDFHRIRPQYHCIAPLHPPFTDEDAIRWFRQMEPVMKDTILFLGCREKPLVERNRLFLDRQVRYLEFGDDWANLANVDFDLARPLPICQSVSIIALIAALYLGCREVYFLGTDHTVFNPNNGHYDYHHFYGQNESEVLANEPEPEDLEETFSCYATLWRQYKILRKFAASKGAAIYNATQGGTLDLFPRVAYERLFANRS